MSESNKDVKKENNSYNDDSYDDDTQPYASKEAIEKGIQEATNKASIIIKTLNKYYFFTFLISSLIFGVFFGLKSLTAFSAGYVIGFLNNLIITLGAVKAISLGPDRALFYMLRKFVSGFVLCAALLFIVMYFLKLSAIPLLIGFTITVILNVTLLYIFSKKELLDNA